MVLVDMEKRLSTALSGAVSKHVPHSVGIVSSKMVASRASGTPGYLGFNLNKCVNPTGEASYCRCNTPTSLSERCGRPIILHLFKRGAKRTCGVRQFP